MKFFIDYSNTSISKYNTGIQRTVKNIIEQTKYHRNNHEFILIDLKNLNNSNNKNIKKKSLIKVPYFIIYSSIVILNKIGIWNFIHLTYFKMVCLKFFRKHEIKNSYYLNIDANWSDHNLYFMKKFQKYGGKVISVYYDNGPYMYPQFFYKDLVTNFTRHWYKAYNLSDLILCISQTISDEFHTYVTNNSKRFNLRKIVPIDYFYLGNEPYSNIDNPLFNVTKKNNFKNYLVVGSIEPRKNNLMILKAFVRLFKDKNFKKNCKLIFIYNNSWMERNLINQIKSTIHYNKNIFLLDDINDRELIYFYKTSYALINASHYEGYGLSVGEALHHNLKVFCSKIKTFEEIYGNSVDYFDKNDPNSLVNLILSDLTKSKRKAKYKSFSWSDSFDMFLNKIFQNIIK